MFKCSTLGHSVIALSVYFQARTHHHPRHPPGVHRPKHLSGPVHNSGPYPTPPVGDRLRPLPHQAGSASSGDAPTSTSRERSSCSAGRSRPHIGSILIPNLSLNMSQFIKAALCYVYAMLCNAMYQLYLCCIYHAKL